MAKKRILILGAGISGMTAAYTLSKSSEFEVTVIERAGRIGGWVETLQGSDFFFENGPRTFRVSRSQALLSLIEELGLKEQCIYSKPESHGRYLWIDGQLKSLPIFSLKFIQGLLREWKVPPKKEDETAWDFACRRFNAEVAEFLFDPWVIGIFAGDIHQVSAKACFSYLKGWEEKYGSLTKGFFKTPRHKGPFLFTLKDGVEKIIEALGTQFKGKICLNETVMGLEFLPDHVKVVTSEGIHVADEVISALPAPVLGRLVAPELLSIPMNGTTVVNVAYRSDVLKKRGFGYIAASREKDEILGVVFNSSVFPDQNRYKEETRLTVKLRRSDMTEQEAIAIALDSLKKHLGIEKSPDFVSVKRVVAAFPQPLVGHQELIQAFEKRMENDYPRLKVVGNYLYGVSLNDCVARAASVASSFLSACVS